MSTATNPSPSQAYEAKTLYADAIAAIEKLPEIQRQTIVLYAEEDFTYDEIALAMNSRLKSLAKRSRRASVPRSPRSGGALHTGAVE